MYLILLHLLMSQNVLFYNFFVVFNTQVYCQGKYCLDQLC